MSLPEIDRCPSTLKLGFSTYSPAAQQTLFGLRSRKVSHLLPFGPPGKTNELTGEYNEKRKRISISGVQEKYSLLQQKNELKLTDSNGSHILKPIPMERLEKVIDMPANEHVSMQMASQIFGIRTAACGMIFFDDGTPGYITRRFDYRPDGKGKYQVEDFATLLGKTPEHEGNDFKYNASYLDMANLIHDHVAAAPVVLLEFFKIVLFNYLIANGDAHLKNFSLMESSDGDYLLAPAYDLLCTRLHIDDSVLGLHNGLYENDQLENSYQNFGTYTARSFLVFAEKMGIPAKVAADTMNRMMKAVPEAMDLIRKSFLSDESKEQYIQLLGDRHSSLKLK
jgi:serine/threonine-protein kinase HipA